MSYKVIHHFTDLQDFNHAYQVGDIFPRLGMKVSEARLAELSSKNNKQGKPLIKYVEDKEVKKVSEVKTVENEMQYNKTVINRMSTTDLRNLAEQKGIEEAAEKSGAELKKKLIKLLGL